MGLHGNYEFCLETVFKSVTDNEFIMSRKEKIREGFARIIERSGELDEISLEDVICMAKNVDALMSEHFGYGRIIDIMDAVQECKAAKGQRRLL